MLRGLPLLLLIEFRRTYYLYTRAVIYDVCAKLFCSGFMVNFGPVGLSFGIRRLSGEMLKVAKFYLVGVLAGSP